MKTFAVNVTIHVEADSAGAAEYDEMLTAGVVEEPQRSNADRMTPAQLQDKWDRLGGLHVP